MIFNYDPITGLNYYSYSEEIFSINLPHFDEKTIEQHITEWKEIVRKTGVQIIDSSKSTIEEVHMPIYSNVPYEVFKERVG